MAPRLATALARDEEVEVRQIAVRGRQQADVAALNAAFLMLS
jgi:hypothetical protein